MRAWHWALALGLIVLAGAGVLFFASFRGTHLQPGTRAYLAGNATILAPIGLLLLAFALDRYLRARRAELAAGKEKRP